MDVPHICEVEHIDYLSVDSQRGIVVYAGGVLDVRTGCDQLEEASSLTCHVFELPIHDAHSEETSPDEAANQLIEDFIAVITTNADTSVVESTRV